MNPMKMLQIKSAWDKFQQNHPKFISFFKAVRARGLREGTILEIKVVTPEGEELITNLKVNQEDLSLIQQLTELARQQ